MTVAATSNSTPHSELINQLNNAVASKGASKSNTQALQDRFLTLLVTQLKNQDPTDPMDNAELTMQLAQMSTVEGISKLNTSLATLLTQSQNAVVMQGASLVGHQVLATGDSLELTSSGAVGGVDLASAVDRATVSIYDPKGALVKTIELGQSDAGFSRFAWDGKDNAGKAVATGEYTFKVTASAEGESVDATTYALGSVISVSLLNGELSAEIARLGDRGMNQIKQIF
jgi:flagellar basal-body rod modification protein FlgD